MPRSSDLAPIVLSTFYVRLKGQLPLTFERKTSVFVPLLGLKASAHAAAAAHYSDCNRSRLHSGGGLSRRRYAACGWGSRRCCANQRRCARCCLGLVGARSRPLRSRRRHRRRKTEAAGGQPPCRHRRRCRCRRERRLHFCWRVCPGGWPTRPMPTPAAPLPPSSMLAATERWLFLRRLVPPAALTDSSPPLALPSKMSRAPVATVCRTMRAMWPRLPIEAAVHRVSPAGW